MPTFFQALARKTTAQQQQNKLFRFLSHVLIIFNRLTVVQMLFGSLKRDITPKICRLCVCVLINKRSFKPFMCLDLQDRTS